MCSEDRFAYGNGQYTRTHARYTPGNGSTARKNQLDTRVGRGLGRFGNFSSRRALCGRSRELVNTSNYVEPIPLKLWRQLRFYKENGFVYKQNGERDKVVTQAHQTYSSGF